MALNIREAIEFGRQNEALMLIDKIISIKKAYLRAYYLALRINLKDYDNIENNNELYQWFSDEGSVLKDMNDLKSPEAYLFIYKVLGEIAIRKKDQYTFNLAVGNSEKIINFYELVEYSDSLYKLKSSWGKI